MVDAVATRPSDVTLDFFLTPNDPDHLEEVASAPPHDLGASACHEPCRMPSSSRRSTRYDVGVHLLPPSTSTSGGRCRTSSSTTCRRGWGCVIGPSPEMAGLVEQWGVGVVSPRLLASSRSRRRSTSLDRRHCRGASRRASHAHARSSSAEIEVAGWERAVDALVRGRRRMSRPSLLILSFSPIADDARVLKQVRLFAGRYDVTTCGYGPAPEGVVRHLRGARPTCPRGARTRGGCWRRQYSRVYWGNAAWPTSAACCPVGEFDAVLADDVDTVPLALSLQPRARGARRPARVRPGAEQRAAALALVRGAVHPVDLPHASCRRRRR